MCYHPITIVNPSKYVSLKYRDRFILQVPCGKCAECQKSKSNEWYFRSYNHAVDNLTKSRSNFILFDTLTYDNENLPHLSDFVRVDKDLDFPCFNRKHIRLFIADLRQRFKRKYNSNFTFFIASEYGSRRGCTHRPHYHLLLYVDGSIKPHEASKEIADVWKYGRTDGLPWKPASYVLNHNTFRLDDLAHGLRCCRYVSKYIQKSCEFQSQLDKRVNALMHRIADDYEVFNEDADNWLESVEAARLRQSYKRLVNQFHTQSTQFGASALANIDLLSLFRTGSLMMPDGKSVVKPIGLPMYYKRKLFYELIDFNGSKVWQLTELGLQYQKARSISLRNHIADKLQGVIVQNKLKYDAVQLADYMLDYRGRIKSQNGPSTSIVERAENADFYCYVTQTDRLQFGSVGLSPSYLGNCNVGYSSDRLIGVKTFFFSQRFCFFDEEKEKQLNDIFYNMLQIDVGKQKGYELRQRLVNLYKSI